MESKVKNVPICVYCTYSIGESAYTGVGSGVAHPYCFRMHEKNAALVRFLVEWRMRILDHVGGNAGKLPEDQFGQLVTLNTIIYYLEG